MRTRGLLPLLALLSLTGCKSLDLNQLPWPSQLGWLKNYLAEREEVTYYPTARENFHKGMENYTKEEWEDAAKYFDYVRTKFPHSKYAIMAELRLADAYFGKEKWLDAIDAYKSFVRLHPTHDAVPYATFQIAKSYYRQIPEEWFFLPSVAERDQRASRDALMSLDDFLIRFPDHERAKEARTLRKELRTRLADHEWYVAKYYEKDHKKGAAFRYERIADLYPDVDDAPEALMNAAAIWEKLGDLDRARVDFERVARDYGNTKFAAQAKTRAKTLADRKAAEEKKAAEKAAKEAAEKAAREAALRDAGPAPDAAVAEEQPGEEGPEAEESVDGEDADEGEPAPDAP
ncbi:MAG: outer membrane protein assembly factor BamD [Myxococcota bacterium]